MCIEHLEAGTAAPRLENVTPVSAQARDRKLRLPNQDRQTINRLLTRFLNADCAAFDSYSV